MQKNIRNICIIAHVDHGKTTLVDNLFKATGIVEKTGDDVRVMDSGAIEKERGITIQAKNASFEYKGAKVNIIDTPGHADFGAEVERVLGMADASILLVDAAEGPLPQTRFVLQKALAHGHKFILCINKVDRPEVRGGNDRIKEVIDTTFDLFLELGASDEQADFPIIYACARKGWCTLNEAEIEDILEGKKKADLVPMLDIILNTFPKPRVQDYPDFRMLVSNLDYNDFWGQIAIGRIISGKIKSNEKLWRMGVTPEGKEVRQGFQVVKLLTFSGLVQAEATELEAGDIGLIVGCEDFQIGDTLTNNEKGEALERIKVDVPTMNMIFTVNMSPLSGRDGEAVQSRKLGERLLRECRRNVAFKLRETAKPEEFLLLGRGELQFSVLIEQMRREGLEFMVGRPAVVMQKDENGEQLEPIEKVVVDLPEAYTGDITNMLQTRKAIMLSYEPLLATEHGQRIRLTFEMPTRGLIGIRSKFLTLTKGEGIMSSEFLQYGPFKGDFNHRQHGTLISDRAGKTTTYALATIEERGVMFVEPGVEVYEGMIIGEHNRENDLNVNACREKKMTNVRAAGSDGLTILAGVRKMTLERCIEFMEDDEWLEVTPLNIRMRKKILAANMRSVIR